MTLTRVKGFAMALFVAFAALVPTSSATDAATWTKKISIESSDDPQFTYQFTFKSSGDVAFEVIAGPKPWPPLPHATGKWVIVAAVTNVVDASNSAKRLLMIPKMITGSMAVGDKIPNVQYDDAGVAGTATVTFVGN